MSRVMAMDVGDRRIGIALSDPLGMFAQGLTTIVRDRRPENDLPIFKALVEEHDVSRIVVGWPLETSGRAGGQARKVERFVDNLKTVIELPFELWDERLTSAQAERALLEADTRRSKRKELIDKVAATVILQSWLDAQR